MKSVERSVPSLRQISGILRREKGIFENPTLPLTILFKDFGIDLFREQEEDLEALDLIIARSSRTIALTFRPDLEYKEEAVLLAHMVGHLVSGHLKPLSIILEPPCTERDQYKKEADYIQNLILYGGEKQLLLFDWVPNRLLKLFTQIAARH